MKHATLAMIMVLGLQAAAHSCVQDPDVAVTNDVTVKDLAGTCWMGSVEGGGASVFLAMEFPEDPTGEVLFTMPNALALRKSVTLGGTEVQPTITLAGGEISIVVALELEEKHIGGTLEARGANGVLQQAGTISLDPWTPPEDFSSTGVYAGKVELPGGAKLDLIMELGYSKDEASARISIPLQNVESYPAVATQTDGTWEIEANFGTVVTIQLKPEGQDGLEGTMSQSGFEMDVVLEKLTEEEIARDPRPQTPKPPFPYVELDARIPSPQGHELIGTLLLPDGVKQPPVVVLVTGSGPQDRDETVMGHKPFLILADALARRGIASLRYDDRGVGESTGDYASATTMAFADDALAAVAWLRKRDDVDPKWIGIVGHSEGGLVAPIAVSKDPEIAFAVLMAGTGVDGGRILTSQSERIMKVSGMDQAAIDGIIARHEELMDAVREDASDEEIRRRYILLSDAQVEAGRAELGDEKTDELLETTRQQVEAMDTPFNDWMVAFIKIDPRSYLSQMKCPVLAINGTNDVQVISELNLPEIERAITTGGGTVTIIEYEGLNHLFQKSESGAVEEYVSIETTIEPEVLDDIATWILETSGHTDP